MRTTAEGIELIKHFEGCRLQAYQDQAGIWTCGWGRTGGVGPDTVITQQEADAWFLMDIEAVEQELGKLVPQSLNDYQFSALVSFCYNVGFGKKNEKSGFRTLKTGGPSTMLKLIQAEQFALAADEFPKWDKISGTPSNAILERRLAERALFLKG